MRAVALISILVLVASLADARPKNKPTESKAEEPHPNAVTGKDEAPKNAKLARPAPEKKPSQPSTPSVVRKTGKPESGMPRPTFPMAPPAAAPSMLDPRTRMAMMMQAAQMQQMMQQQQQQQQQQQGQGQMDPRTMMAQGMGFNPQQAMAMGSNPFASKMPTGQGPNMTPLSQQQQQQMMMMAMMQQQQMMKQQQMMQQRQQAMMAAQGQQERQPISPMDPREAMVMQLQQQQQQQLDQIKEMQRQQQEQEAPRSDADQSTDSMPAPMRQGLKAFRDRMMAMRAQGRGDMSAQMPTMAQNPMMQQGQMMGRPQMMPPQMMMGQNKPMVPPQMMAGRPPMMSQQNPMMPPQMMAGRPPMMAGRPPMMSQQNPMMPPQMMAGRPPMMSQQNPMMPPQMMAGRPPMMSQQNPMMPPQMMAGRPPMMSQQNPMMPPQMMGRPPMMGPQNPMMMMGPGPMMPSRGPMMPSRGPMMGPGGPMIPRNPIDPSDIESLRSVLAPGKGPIAVPLHSIQHVMGLENKLTDIRDELIRSFYMDLMQFKAMSQQFKSQMSSKLNLIHQIDAKLGTPIRSALADLSTKHHLNLPLSSPNGPESTIIRRLKQTIDDSKKVYTPSE